MLIDIGRVTGNLKHRMVTMVAMRNVYKLMGARLVKSESRDHLSWMTADGDTDGKWVTDDYYEDEALSRCAENGFTPYTVAHEDGIIANAMSLMQPQGRPAQQTSTDQAQRPAVTLAPFYSLGGPTTHFAGSGADPWSEAGWGHKRSRLRNQGVSEGDWMFRIAEECRRVDAMLREYREERLKVLDKVDASKGWVYAVEQGTEKAVEEDDGWLRPVTPTLERKWSGLSQEVTFPGAVDHEAAQAPGDGNVSMEADADVVVVEEDQAGKIVGQTPGEEEEGSSRWRWGIGGEWKPGIIRAAYEVSPITRSISRPVLTERHSLILKCPIYRSIPSPRAPRTSAFRHTPSSAPSPTHSTRTSSRAPSPAELPEDSRAWNTSSNPLDPHLPAYTSGTRCEIRTLIEQKRGRGG